MRLLIDADGCPVVDICVTLAKKHQAECLILCDTSHVFEKDGATTITISKGADSVDFALVNMVQPGDIVVTQDYGLAAMALAKRAVVLNQDGVEYTQFNIDSMLNARHTAKKIRNAGGRIKGPPKRMTAQNEAFAAQLERLLMSTDS
ncbi:YaiI/YqxD family protein [Ruminococcaceae bacterium OttesenSCG-928-A11]|nr:YaiI/YqxD family protein [Ruminococcaceae bacterium OttesenSCG-928-A11]